MVEDYPSLYYVWVGMNVENETMADINLRKAVQHCIDVPSILQASYFGAAEASTGIIAPGLTGHRPKSMVAPTADIAGILASRDSCMSRGIYVDGSTCEGWGNPCLTCTGFRDFDWTARAWNTIPLSCLTPC